MQPPPHRPVTLRPQGGRGPDLGLRARMGRPPRMPTWPVRGNRKFQGDREAPGPLSLENRAQQPAVWGGHSADGAGGAASPAPWPWGAASSRAHSRALPPRPQALPRGGCMAPRLRQALEARGPGRLGQQSAGLWDHRGWQRLAAPCPCPTPSSRWGRPAPQRACVHPWLGPHGWAPLLPSPPPRGSQGQTLHCESTDMVALAVPARSGTSPDASWGRLRRCCWPLSGKEHSRLRERALPGPEARASGPRACPPAAVQVTQTPNARGRAPLVGPSPSGRRVGCGGRPHTRGRLRGGPGTASARRLRPTRRELEGRTECLAVQGRPGERQDSGGFGGASWPGPQPMAPRGPRCESYKRPQPVSGGRGQACPGPSCRTASGVYYHGPDVAAFVPCTRPLVLVASWQGTAPSPNSRAFSVTRERFSLAVSGVAQTRRRPRPRLRESRRPSGRRSPAWSRPTRSSPRFPSLLPAFCHVVPHAHALIRLLLKRCLVGPRPGAEACSARLALPAPACALGRAPASPSCPSCPPSPA